MSKFFLPVLLVHLGEVPEQIKLLYLKNQLKRNYYKLILYGSKLISLLHLASLILLVMRHAFGNMQLFQNYSFLVSLVDHVMGVLLKYSVTRLQAHTNCKYYCGYGI